MFILLLILNMFYAFFSVSLWTGNFISVAKNERIYSSLANSHYAEAYLELFQTSKMEHVAKIVNGF